MITDNSQTIYDQLKIINENIDSVKELFSNALRYKTDLNDQNNSITRVFSKCAGNLSIFESDLKTLAVKIKALDSGISESYSASKAQGGVYEKLDSLYDRDRKRAEEIEVLIAEIEKISQALKDELGSLR
jgi:chromosome segregation ATPase